MTVRYQLDDPADVPCPDHPDNLDCWCAARVAMLEALALAAEADVALAGYVAHLDPAEVRIQRLETIGPVTKTVLGAMLANVRARFEQAALIGAALDGIELPAGIDPPEPPSSGCIHLSTDPSLWGWWHASAAGMWRCNACADSIGPPDCCDSCGQELDDDNRHVTALAHWSAYRPPKALWPPLLVVISYCQRCNLDDLNDLDDDHPGRG